MKTTFDTVCFVLVVIYVVSKFMRVVVRPRRSRRDALALGLAGILLVVAYFFVQGAVHSSSLDRQMKGFVEGFAFCIIVALAYMVFKNFNATGKRSNLH